jgi:hypothetical protein
MIALHLYIGFLDIIHVKSYPHVTVIDDYYKVETSNYCSPFLTNLNFVLKKYIIT